MWPQLRSQRHPKLLYQLYVDTYVHAIAIGATKIAVAIADDNLKNMTMIN
jgi:hypothetical protein